MSNVLLKKIPREPAYRVVATAIRNQILGGEIKAGDALPVEGVIAEMLGVNRLTVREGIRLLEQSGLVRRNGGKKLYASVPQTHDVAENVTSALLMHDTTFMNLWEVMHVLEPLAASSAATRADAALLKELDENLAKTRDALDERNNLILLDVEFHRLIAEGSSNSALLLARVPLSQLFYPAFEQVISRLNTGERMLVAHTEIVNALKARDAAKAADWMRKHIVDFQRGYKAAGLDIDEVVGASSRHVHR